MRVRWILVAIAIGMYFAWRLENPMAAYFTAFGCMILYSLRQIEGRMVGTPKQKPLPPEKIDYDSPQWKAARERAQLPDDPDGLWDRLNKQESDRSARILLRQQEMSNPS